MKVGFRGPESGFLVVDAENGELLKNLPVGPQAHNSIASIDDQFVFLGTETNLTVFRPSDDSVVRTFKGVGESGVFPFTIDSRGRYAYVCLGKHVGFDVLNLQADGVPYRVLAGEAPIAQAMRRHSSAHGIDCGRCSTIRRTETSIQAPSFRRRSRRVFTCARAREVWAAARRKFIRRSDGGVSERGQM
mgnify:CR=1 FL=1